jgi:phenylalanyl-tRNA synthetase beta chain
MLISYSWLQRHVDLSGIDPQTLGQDLTLSTAEVEGIEAFAPHLADVTVGLVKSREQHPDADKLGVCMVDVGGEEDLQIVCGAPNVGAGIRVAVATVGTLLPGDFKIKKSKIRGVASMGMICSVRELDLGDEHDGIWVLPEEAEVGTSVAKALGLEDWIIEIDNKSITHRPDMWGHRGVARELAAIYERELKPLDLSLPKTGSASAVPVQIEDGACSRYIALAVDGVENGKSPEWMRHLLLAVGQRPIDLLVDISNFVMLDLGQPNHLFDRKSLDASGIQVRMGKSGESMQTLDEEERKLGEQDLLICSGDNPVAIAGIMGGESSKVGDDTGELLLEVAAFDAVTIRRTASRIGLRTDASTRFEKSLDPNLPMQAAGHLVRLLQEMQPNIQLPSAPTDVGDWTDPSMTIELRGARVRRLLGVDLDNTEIARLLSSIEFGVSVDDDLFKVVVPANRATKDIAIEQDLIEEVGRLYRYDNIPERRLTGEIAPTPFDARQDLVRCMQDRLAGGARFHEVLSYSFVATSLLEKLGAQDEKYVTLVNPVVDGEVSVRRNLVPGLLNLMEKNRRHHTDVRLFEIGKGYLPEGADERGLPAEVHELALVWTRPAPPKKSRFDASLFPQMQAVLEDLCRSLGFGLPTWSLPDEDDEGFDLAPWFHPGHCLVGTFPAAENPKELTCPIVFGKLDPGLHKPLGLSQELAGEALVAQVSLDDLLQSVKPGFQYAPIPRFPGNKVDVALAMPVGVPAGALVAAIEKAGKGLVKSAELFDLYTGPGIGEGRKSLAYHVLLQSDSKTLTDKDAAKFITRLERLAGELGGELRSE